MTCIECEKIKSRKNLVYEDDKAIAFLVDKPATAGHVEIIPKEHFPILEKVPEDIVEHLFVTANKLSTVLFESMQAHGTNTIIRNGIAAGQKTNHLKIHVIPRVENDGLNFQWSTTKASEDELSTAELMLKTELEKPPEQKPIEMKKEPKEEISEESYLSKQLERIP